MLTCVLCSTCIYVHRRRSHDLFQQINGKEAYFAVQIRVKDILFKTPEAADVCMHAHPRLILVQFKACVHTFQIPCVCQYCAVYIREDQLCLYGQRQCMPAVTKCTDYKRKPPTADDNCCLSHICAGLMPHAKSSIFNVYTYHWWQVCLAKTLVEMDSTQFLEAASHNGEDTACVPVNRTAFFMNVCGA